MGTRCRSRLTGHNPRSHSFWPQSPPFSFIDVSSTVYHICISQLENMPSRVLRVTIYDLTRGVLKTTQLRPLRWLYRRNLTTQLTHIDCFVIAMMTMLSNWDPSVPQIWFYGLQISLWTWTFQVSSMWEICSSRFLSFTIAPNTPPNCTPRSRFQWTVNRP